MHMTYKLRLCDKYSAELNRQSQVVNFVWNYCNEIQRKSANDRRPWLSSFDLQLLTAGASKELDIHAHTIKRICNAYCDARKASKKPWLRWRGRKSLGWVPFNTAHVTFDGETFGFRKVRYRTMHIRDEIPAGVKIGAGSFNRDAKGHWYINCQIEVECAARSLTAKAGIDLGLKELAVLSSGERIKAPHFYRKSEAVLATAQRAKKTKRAKAIHAKIRNRRKDFLHKESARLTKEYGLIVIGDVSPSKLAKTRMAKSVLDAGWADFKRMLAYKSIRNGGSTLEVSEAYSSQTCSDCGVIGGPKGIAGLGIREWKCDCGSVHDRDVNAARNILRLGLETLGVGAAQMRSSHTSDGGLI